MFSFLSLIIISSIFNFFFVFILINKLLPIFENYFLDFPNQRSIHISPKPTGGGIIIITASLITYSLLFLLIERIPNLESSLVHHIQIIILLCLPISVLGFIDDLYDIESKFKFGIQTITAILFITFIDLFIFQTDNNIMTLTISLFFIIFISGIINLINFMDGIDGLICGIFTFIFLILSIKKNILFLPLSLGCLGFLKNNWYPSRIFMGDTGSTFLGAFYGALIISSESLKEAVSMLLLISPIFIDSISCILRRLKLGHNIFRPHKLHLYQRLVQNGISHDNVSIMYIGSSLLTSIFYIGNRFILEIISVIIIFTIGIYLEKKYAKPFPNKF